MDIVINVINIMQKLNYKLDVIHVKLVYLHNNWDRKLRKTLEFGVAYHLRLLNNFCMLFHVIIEQNKIGISLIFNFMKQY